jgi:hypothetical protein
VLPALLKNSVTVLRFSTLAPEASPQRSAQEMPAGSSSMVATIYPSIFYETRCRVREWPASIHRTAERASLLLGNLRLEDGEEPGCKKPRLFLAASGFT